MRTLPFLIAIPFLLVAICLEAQFQDRLYPFRELTDEMRARIDLKDGSVEDWLEVLGEPTLTPLDFVIPPWSPEYDPSSYDFRIWLAWHDATDHLFVAAQIVDDYHLNEYDRYGDNLPPDGDAAMSFLVDGDLSGGMLSQGSFFEDNLYFCVQAQHYYAFAQTYSNDSNLHLKGVSDRDRTSWVHHLPYADGGGAIVDSQPVLSVLEFHVTAFDRLIWDDVEQNVISELFAGKTIGFALALADRDTAWDDEVESGPPPVDSVHHLFGPGASYDPSKTSTGLFRESDLWAHGILLGADGGSDGTAVESVTWGRIKASLSE